MAEPWTRCVYCLADVCHECPEVDGILIPGCFGMIHEESMAAAPYRCVCSPPVSTNPDYPGALGLQVDAFADSIQPGVRPDRYWARGIREASDPDR